MQEGKIYTGTIGKEKAIVEITQKLRTGPKNTKYKCRILHKNKMLTNTTMTYPKQGSLEEATTEEIEEYAQAKAIQTAREL